MATVVIIGKNYSTTLGVVRSLGMAGHEVWLLHTGWSKEPVPFIAAKSKYVKRYEYAYVRDIDNVLNILLTKYKKEGEKIVLIPTDDVNTQTVDVNAEVLSQYFYLPSINKRCGEIDRFMDKAIQKAFAKKCGFNVAQSCMVNIRNKEYTIPQEISYPCITKPVLSNNSNKKDICTCSNLEQLRIALDRLAQRGDFDVMLEEYLTIEDEFTVTGYSWGKECFLPYVIKKIRTAVNHKGVTSIGELQQPDNYDFIQTIKLFLSNLCYYGLCDIEIIKSNGKFYFNEMNLRGGAPLFAITRAGVNLPDLLVKRYYGEVIQESFSSYSTPPRFVSEKAEFEDYLSRDVTFGKYLKDIKDVDYALIRYDEDPGPYKMFSRMVWEVAIGRWIPFKSLIRRMIQR